MNSKLEEIATAQFGHYRDELNGNLPATRFAFYRAQQGLPYSELTAWLNTQDNVQKNTCAFLPNIHISEGALSAQARNENPNEDRFFSTQSAQKNNTILICVPDKELPGISPDTTPFINGSPSELAIYGDSIDNQNKLPLRQSLAAVEFETNGCDDPKVSFINVGKQDLSLVFYNTEPLIPDVMSAISQKRISRDTLNGGTALTVSLPHDNKNRSGLEISYTGSNGTFPAYLVHTMRIEFLRKKAEQKQAESGKSAMLKWIQNVLPFSQGYVTQGNFYVHQYTPID